jgi:Tol biopolymer transport system component
MRRPMLAVLVLLLLAGAQRGDAQPAPPAPQEPGTYLLNLASGALVRVATVPLVGPLPARLAWSPDSTLLAVAAPTGSEAPSGAPRVVVRIMELATGGERVVALPAEGEAGGLSWSPDGRHLAFSFSPYGVRSGPALYVASPAQGAVQQLLPDVGMFAWTPDSQAITAIQLADPPNGRILTVNAQTGDTVATVRSGDVTCLLGPAWSPDGAYLAFGAPGLTQGCPTAGLWSWEASAGTTRQLFTSAVDRPLWMPDGDILVDLALVEGDVAARAIGRFRPDGSGSSILVRDIPRSFPPAFSPVQTARGTVLYAVLSCDQGAAFVVAPGSAQPRQLSDPSVVAYEPRLSPDGALVAWGTVGARGNDLVVAAVAGGGARTVLHDIPGLAVGGWSPDARSLAFAVTGVAQPGLPCGPQ